MKIILIQKWFEFLVDQRNVKISSLIVASPPVIFSGLYFVYFFGPAFEYTWTQANLLVPYSGLDEFIRYAEVSVQNVRLFIVFLFLLFLFLFQATTKREQETLATRFELKVAANKRPHW
jgi:hypothetical protein